MNRESVEERFEEAGFAVIRPENHLFGQQLDFVRNASVVAGLAGSVMMHIAFAERPVHVIVVMPDSYHANNEQQISALLGHRLDLVVCRSEVQRKGKKFDPSSYRAPFSLDWTAEGQFLDAVLAEIR